MNNVKDIYEIYLTSVKAFNGIMMTCSCEYIVSTLKCNDFKQSKA